MMVTARGRGARFLAGDAIRQRSPGTTAASA